MKTLKPILTNSNWISFEKDGGEGVTGNLVCPNCSDCFLKDPSAVIIMDPDPSEKCIVCDIEVREFKKKKENEENAITQSGEE